MPNGTPRVLDKHNDHEVSLSRRIRTAQKYHDSFLETADAARKLGHLCQPASGKPKSRPLKLVFSSTGTLAATAATVCSGRARRICQRVCNGGQFADRFLTVLPGRTRSMPAGSAEVPSRRGMPNLFIR